MVNRNLCLLITCASGGRPGWGNNELEWYTAGSNVAVSNGNAVITIRYNTTGGDQMYTSTRMKTVNTRFWAPADGVNGAGIRVEARMQLPTGAYLLSSLSSGNLI
jgi:hypothetical protein